MRVNTAMTKQYPARIRRGRSRVGGMKKAGMEMRVAMRYDIPRDIVTMVSACTPKIDLDKKRVTYDQG
jgi:hypothetical protein